MRKKAVVVLVLLLVTVFGCAGPAEEYVDADELTYRALAPDAAWGIKNNPALGEEEKARHLRSIRTWKLRLEKAGHKDVPDVTEGP